LEVCSRPAAEEADWSALQQSWAGFFKKKIFFSFMRCKGCGMLYCRHYFTDEQLVQLYAHMADNTAGLGAEQTNVTQVGYVRLINDGSLTGDFLELGPDIGLFSLAYARSFDKGTGRKYWLFEPNESVHPELDRRMAGYCHEIRTEMTDFSSVPDGSIGTVAMIHVLDHLRDPLAVLRELKKKMHVGGARIHIVTHNERSALARVLKRRWPAYCLQHPQLFNPSSITELLKTAGFGEITVQRTMNYFPLGYLAKHGLYALGLNLRFLGRVPTPQVGLHLGNMLTSART